MEDDWISLRFLKVPKRDSHITIDQRSAAQYGQYSAPMKTICGFPLDCGKERGRWEADHIAGLTAGSDRIDHGRAGILNLSGERGRNRRQRGGVAATDLVDEHDDDEDDRNDGHAGNRHHCGRLPRRTALETDRPYRRLVASLLLGNRPCPSLPGWKGLLAHRLARSVLCHGIRVPDQPFARVSAALRGFVR